MRWTKAGWRGRSEAVGGDSDARAGRHIYVAALPLRKTRSSARLVKNLAKR